MFSFTRGLIAMLALSPLAAMAQEAVAEAPKIDTGDTAWVMVCAALVMLMTPGLAFFYAGMARTKNVVSTLFQNFAALGVLGILWAVCGYSLSFGTSHGGFIGGFNYLFLNGVGAEPNADYAATIPHSVFMIFQCMFAVITPVLMTGAIAERVKFKGVLAFCVFWSLFVYYPVAHWVWGVGGFVRNMGGLDFAGGLVVHMTAGYSAILAAILLKKRTDFGKVEMKSYDTGMVALGTALLWFGWFGFNAGSALAANGLAAAAFGNTFFAAGAAFVAWMIVDNFKRSGKPSFVGACVAAVAGLVAITPAAGFITFTAAIFLGLLTGVICNYAVAFVKEKLQLDDSLDVFGCHAVGGTLGVIFTGLFSTTTVNGGGANGLFYGSFDLLKANLIGAFAVICISLIGTFVAYKICDMLFGMRVNQLEETAGLDKSQHAEVINSSIAS
jgi:ammonium transporter, Amt family